MNSYRSFAITIRPKDGISDVVCDALKTYCAKCDYATMILEKDGVERHAHIQVWYNDDKYKGDVKRAFVRICEKYVDDWCMSQRKYCVYVKICYNNWIENYCEENDIKINDESYCVFDNKPLNDDEFYPSQEEQDKVKDKANAVDKYYYDLNVKFNEWYEDGDITIGMVAKFLAYAMYDVKIIKVKRDKRERINLCKNLFYYIGNEANACDFLNVMDEEIYINELMSKCPCPIRLK